MLSVATHSYLLLGAQSTAPRERRALGLILAQGLILAHGLILAGRESAAWFVPWLSWAGGRVVRLIG